MSAREQLLPHRSLWTGPALNEGERPTLSNGRSYDLYDLRPDGVHVSRAGTQYLVEEILRKLMEQPPSRILQTLKK